MVAEFGGHGGVVREEPQVALLVGDVSLEDFFALGVVALGPTVAPADEIGGDGAGVVAIAEV